MDPKTGNSGPKTDQLVEKELLTSQRIHPSWCPPYPLAKHNHKTCMQGGLHSSPSTIPQ